MKQIFRTICSVVAIMAMAVIAASCAKDELSKEAQQRIPGVERTISATATLPQDADKAHIDGSRKVIWDMGDELNINGTNVTISRIGPDGTTAKFDESTVHANTISGTDHYWAVYPTTLAGAYSGGLPTEFTSTTALTVHFPDTQIVDITLADTLNGLTYMASHVAVADGAEKVHFQMRNLGAVLELDLTPYCANNTRVDSIVFTSSNASLAGTFTVSSNASNPTITPTAGTNKLVVKFKDGSNKYIDITGGKKVRVILPPLASKNLNMKIYGNGKAMGKNATSVTIARNNYYSSAINFDVSRFAAPDVVGFSVAADRRVLFSPGNLQWSATGGGTTYTTHATADGVGGDGTWRFAPNQWDYIGDVAGNTTPDPSRSTQSDWIDLFRWGTSGYHDASDPYNTNYFPYNYYKGTVNTTYNYYGYGPSINMTDPNLTGTSANYDWGVYNAIYNPKTGSTDPAGTWRSLTLHELYYLINTRTIIINCNTTKRMCGQANVNGANGLVILPDNWNPTSCPSFVYYEPWVSAYSDNTFTEFTSPKWSDMEAFGCVFLPAAGAHNYLTVTFASSYGYYWTSTHHNSGFAESLYICSNYINAGYDNYVDRWLGFSVRLVKDVH